MLRKSDNQATYFSRYLSLSPVLAVFAVSVAISAFIVINYYFPDGLYMGWK